MDPNKAIQELFDACRDGNQEAAIDATANLLGWLRGGGFLPTDPRAGGSGAAA